MQTAGTTARWLWDRFLRRTPRQDRSRAVVDAIVDAYAERVESGEGVSEHALSDLMRRAGVAAGSFYEYFSGRESLLGGLIARLTQKNFDELLMTLERAEPRSLDELIRAMASASARTYLARPKVLRAVVEGIERFGLHKHIVHERDRFVAEVAARSTHLAPHMSAHELEHAMRVVADAAMGVIVAAALREDAPDVARVERDLELLGSVLQRRADLDRAS